MGRYEHLQAKSVATLRRTMMKKVCKVGDLGKVDEKRLICEILIETFQKLLSDTRP